MKKLMKAASYVATPEFSTGRKMARKAARHAGKWAMKRAMPKRRQMGMGGMALRGLGAAAIALPLGWWLGRQLMDRGDATR